MLGPGLHGSQAALAAMTADTSSSNGARVLGTTVPGFCSTVQPASSYQTGAVIERARTLPMRP